MQIRIPRIRKYFKLCLKKGKNSFIRPFSALLCTERFLPIWSRAIQYIVCTSSRISHFFTNHILSFYSNCICNWDYYNTVMGTMQLPSVILTCIRSPRGCDHLPAKKYRGGWNRYGHWTLLGFVTGNVGRIQHRLSAMTPMDFHKFFFAPHKGILPTGAGRQDSKYFLFIHRSLFDWLKPDGTVSCHPSVLPDNLR